MARPLRIEYPGALYHLTSRGDGRESIYFKDSDKTYFLILLGETCKKYQWTCYAYCLMGNHYHLLVETSLGNLSRGMRHLNGVYTQKINKVYGRVGHVFQGRFKSILVEEENYLLELARYIVLNPVRANLVEHVKDWHWSSYLYTSAEKSPPNWLKVEKILSYFGENRQNAKEKYVDFVQAGLCKKSPWKELKHDIYLGSEAFVEKWIEYGKKKEGLHEIPKIQYTQPEPPPPLTLSELEVQASSRDDAISAAYSSNRYTMKEIGDHFHLHYSSVSRIVNRLSKGKT